MKPLTRWFALSCLLACQRQTAPTSAAPAPVMRPEATLAAPLSTVAPVQTASPESIYDLPVTLVDGTGSTRTLDSLRGGPVLITMFYGSCASACPLLTSDLKRIEAKLPESVRAKTRVVMVSFDQARDTPEVLRRLTLERGMNPARWTLASANDADARALAGVLGIRYRKLDNGTFFHSSVIVLLDDEGRPRARLDGLGQDATPILSALAASS
jgi:protein SCO1/2